MSVGAAICARCGEPRYRHHQSSGMPLCPVQAFAFLEHPKAPEPVTRLVGYLDLNDCAGRPDDDAIEVPLRDLRELAHSYGLDSA